MRFPVAFSFGGCLPEEQRFRVVTAVAPLLAQGRKMLNPITQTLLKPSFIISESHMHSGIACKLHPAPYTKDRAIRSL